MPEGPSVSIHGKRYQLHYFTGTVLSSLKQKETVVTSKGPGSASSNHPIATSFTIDHHELFLADNTGMEQSFQTRNLDLPCREGNAVSIVWVRPEGSQGGAYVHIRNHTTGQHNTAGAQQISSLFDRPLVQKAPVAIALFIVVMAVLDSWWGVAIAFLSALYFGWRALAGAKALLRSDALRSLEAQLSQGHTGR
jgi:hypothetical protein